MRIYLFFVVLLSICMPVFTDSSGSIVWSKKIDLDQNNYFSSIIEDNNENIIIAGYNYTDAYKENFFVVKLGANGEFLWHNTYGNNNVEIAQAIEKIDEKGYLLMGQTSAVIENNPDAWLVGIDNDGFVLWEKSYGGHGFDAINDGIILPDTSFLLLGTTDSFGAGQKDVWIIKTDERGELLWAKALGGEKNEEGVAFLLIPDNEVIILGNTESYGRGGMDYWLLKINTDGEIIWQKTFGTEDNEYAKAIIPTADNGFAVAGYGEKKGWLVKLNKEGEFQWDYKSSNNNIESFNSVVEINAKGYLLLGKGLEGDVFTALDLNGRFIRADNPLEDKKYSAETLMLTGTNRIISGSNYSLGTDQNLIWVMELNYFF